MANAKNKAPDAMKKDMDANADAAKKISEDAQKAWDNTKKEGCDASAGGNSGTCGIGQKASDGAKKADAGKK